MHSRGFAHMDLKVDNVMIRDGNAVLVDMGSAARPFAKPTISRSDASRLADQAASNTTVIIRPPELFEGGLRQGDSFDVFKVDVWGLGCMVREWGVLATSASLNFASAREPHEFSSRSLASTYSLFAAVRAEFWLVAFRG